MNMMMIVLAALLASTTLAQLPDAPIHAPRNYRAVRMDIHPPARQIIDATIGLPGQMPTREKPETSQP